MMTERKYPTRDSGPMYNFPMPTEVIKAELAEARGIVFDLDEELGAAKAKIDRALRLHKPLDYVQGVNGPSLCAECLDESGNEAAWPCDTAKALGVTDET